MHIKYYRTDREDFCGSWIFSRDWKASVKRLILFKSTLIQDNRKQQLLKDEDDVGFDTRDPE